MGKETLSVSEQIKNEMPPSDEEARGALHSGTFGEKGGGFTDFNEEEKNVDKSTEGEK